MRQALFRGIAHDQCVYFLIYVFRGLIDYCLSSYDVLVLKGSIPPNSLTRTGRGMVGRVLLFWTWGRHRSFVNISNLVNMLQRWKTCFSFLRTSPFFCFLLVCAAVRHYDLSRTCRFIFIHFAFTPPDFCARNGRCIYSTDVLQRDAFVLAFIPL